MKRGGVGIEVQSMGEADAEDEPKSRPDEAPENKKY